MNKTPVLLKKGQFVSLNKEALREDISVELRWQKEKESFFSRLLGGFGSKEIEAVLDLGCLFELKNGDKGCIQSLGNFYGALNRSPYIELRKDSGENSSKEASLKISGQDFEEINRMLLFSCIYRGSINWGSIDARMTIGHANDSIEIKLDEYEKNKPMCAIALIENIDDSAKVRHLVEYYSGYRDIDKVYRFGLRWANGSK